MSGARAAMTLQEELLVRERDEAREAMREAVRHVRGKWLKRLWLARYRWLRPEDMGEGWE